MTDQLSKYLLAFLVFFPIALVSQSENAQDLNKNQLFSNQEFLQLKFKYSRKQLKKETNDTTYMNSTLSYEGANGVWDSIAVKIRARGNFRRKSCFFTPIKLKISKKNSKGTLFEDNRKLKVVFPCLNETLKDDYVIKEYLIYKMYEIVMPYYFKTRLVDVEHEDLKNKKIKTYQLKGFVIEDIDKVAERLESRAIKRAVIPRSYDDLNAVRNAMFQFMVGNTDFSATHSHNSKVIYVDKKFVPVSYDFDMAGFVNTGYSVVSQIGRTELPIENVTERYYVGYKRDINLFETVRQEFLGNKDEILSVIDSHKDYFKSQHTFETAKSYILGFFELLADKDAFIKSTYDIALQMD